MKRLGMHTRNRRRAVRDIGVGGRMSGALVRAASRTAMIVGAGTAGALALVGVQARITADRANRDVIMPTYAVDYLAGAGRNGATVEIAVVGDSTAAGVGARSEADSLGAQIATRVSGQLNRPVHVTGYGVSGARAAGVLEQQVPQLRDDGREYDAIMVVVGGNDVTHFTPPGRFQRQYAGVLDAVAAARPGTPVIAVGAGRFLDTFSVPRPLRDIWDAYSQVLERRQESTAAVRAGVGYVDIAEASSLRYRGRRDSVADDGFHPSVVGYGMWADAITPRVIDAVGRRSSSST